LLSTFCALTTMSCGGDPIPVYAIWATNNGSADRVLLLLVSTDPAKFGTQVLVPHDGIERQSGGIAISGPHGDHRDEALVYVYDANCNQMTVLRFTDGRYQLSLGSGGDATVTKVADANSKAPFLDPIDAGCVPH